MKKYLLQIIAVTIVITQSSSYCENKALTLLAQMKLGASSTTPTASSTVPVTNSASSTSKPAATSDSTDMPTKTSTDTASSTTKTAPIKESSKKTTQAKTDKKTAIPNYKKTAKQKESKSKKKKADDKKSTKEKVDTPTVIPYPPIIIYSDAEKGHEPTLTKISIQYQILPEKQTKTIAAINPKNNNGKPILISNTGVSFKANIPLKGIKSFTKLIPIGVNAIGVNKSSITISPAWTGSGKGIAGSKAIYLKGTTLDTDRMKKSAEEQDKQIDKKSSPFGSKLTNPDTTTKKEKNPKTNKPLKKKNISNKDKLNKKAKTNKTKKDKKKK